MGRADEPVGALRLDKWLWHSRLAKTRGLASQWCEEGRIRLNSRVVEKAHTPCRVGDVVVFVRGPVVITVQVQSLPPRRVSPKDVPDVYRDV